MEDPEPANSSSSSNKGKGGASSSSTVVGASLNLSNSIIGAGCIGYGGAMARTGGLASLAIVASFGVLTKYSFDVCVDLAIDYCPAPASFEELGRAAYGRAGRVAVMLSKGSFAFGSIVAYIIILKDNLAPAARHLLLGDDSGDLSGLGPVASFLLDDDGAAFVLSAAVMLPLSLLRDPTPLERFSTLKLSIFVLIIGIVIYLWATTATAVSLNESGRGGQDWGEHWLVVRPGCWQSMGTFLFTFVTHNVVHLVYNSLDAAIRTSANWHKVTTRSILLASAMCVPVGLFVYMTSWEETTSNLFDQYPPSKAVDTCRIFLALCMLFTYPLAFFSVRELLIISLPGQGLPPVAATSAWQSSGKQQVESLLPAVETTPLVANLFASSDVQPSTEASYLMPGNDRQLRTPYHVALTVSLWAVTVVLALAAPSLGDVLNLVGCASGSTIGFLLPALFSFRLRGYTTVALLMLVVGIVVGGFGTYLSLVQLTEDVQSGSLS
jgi:sodium-coupled neutral amino acid transporter 11